MKTIFINKIFKITTFIILILFCLFFANASLLENTEFKDNVQNMEEEDFIITISNQETISIQNSLSGTDVTYAWVIETCINEEVVTSGDTGVALAENEIIDFYYQDVSSVKFQGIIEYDGYRYVSNTFGINDNGEVYLYDSGTSYVNELDVYTRDISDVVSIAYCLFLLVTVLLYYVLPKKTQPFLLLIASIFFYLLSGIQYFLFVLGSAFIAFVVANKMTKNKKEMELGLVGETSNKVKKEAKANLKTTNKGILWYGLLATLGVMIIIKYTDFLITNINALFSTNIALLYLVMPLGLSFYTFIIIAYLMDVYRGKYDGETNFLHFLLFVSFFPQIAQGPISRYNETSTQFKTPHHFNYENICFSCQRILWGFFIKLVLADRVALLVSGIYGDYTTQSWFMLLVAALCFSVQVYADFYSSMEIAIGSAQLFGITLPENFLRPYFATSMPDFWRRWHATLGSFFKDYVFYPISISKPLMKLSVKMRKKYKNNVARIAASFPPIMGVWILTGLWHGSSWCFVAWGLFHGILILLSTAFSQNIQTFITGLGIKVESLPYKVLQMIKVFMLCTIGRIFFKSSSISMASTIFVRIFTFASGLKLIDTRNVDLGRMDYLILIFVCVLLFVVSLHQEVKGSVRQTIRNRNIFIRWPIWLFLLFFTIIFGIYGVGSISVFIYDAF